MSIPGLPRDGLTKSQVDALIEDALDGATGGGAALPDQTGHAGQYLTTDGTDVSWGTPDGAGDMGVAVYDPQGVADDAFDRTNHTGEQAIATVTGLEAALADLLASADAPELIRDTIASALVAGSNVTITPSDAGNTITIASSGGGSTDPEVVLDTVAAALVAGSNITITHDDVNDTITIDATGGGGGANAITVDGTPVETIEFDGDFFDASVVGNTATITFIGEGGGGGGGGINQPYYETIPTTGAAITTGVLSANTAVLMRMPRLAASKDFTSLTVHVGTASGNLDVGAYTTADFATLTRVGSSGSTAVAGTSANQTVSVAFTIPANTDWYLALVADNATATFGRISNTSPSPTKTATKQILNKASAFPLPSSITSPTETLLASQWVLGQ